MGLPLSQLSFDDGSGGFHDEMTLGEARDLLRELVDEGCVCPCCSQMAKVYPRQIYSSMARDLIFFWRAHRFEWGHVRRTLGHDGGDFAKLVYWGLLEPQPGVRDDGSWRTGWWRVTPAGERFVHRAIVVPKYARVYDGRLLGMKGEPISIVDALGKRFDYRELMGY